MKKLFALLVAFCLSATMVSCGSDQEREPVDAGSEIIGHVTDSHSWHLFDYESEGESHAVAVPLPVRCVMPSLTICRAVISVRR